MAYIGFSEVPWLTMDQDRGLTKGFRACRSHPDDAALQGTWPGWTSPIVDGNVEGEWARTGLLESIEQMPRFSHSVTRL